MKTWSVKHTTKMDDLLRHASLQESMTSNIGSPFSPIAISVNPMISANTSTCSILPSANADTGLDGSVPDRIKNAVHLGCLNIRCSHLKANAFSKTDQSRNDQSKAKLTIAVVLHRKNSIAAPQILPVILALPMLVIPITIQTKYQWEDHHIQCTHIDTSQYTCCSQNHVKPSSKTVRRQSSEDQSDENRTGDSACCTTHKTSSHCMQLSFLLLQL